MHRACDTCGDNIESLRYTPKCGRRCRAEIQSPFDDRPSNRCYTDSSSTEEEEDDDASEFNAFIYRRNVHKSISAHAKLGGTSLKKHSKNSFEFKEKNIEKDCLEADSESDSDAEFAVHPCLRGLIKSRSACSFKSASVHKGPHNMVVDPLIASFKGFDLSRMMVSRADSFHEELEPEVAYFSGELFENWPSPEENQKQIFEENGSNDCGTTSETLNGFLNNEVNPAKEEGIREMNASTCWSAPANIIVRGDACKRDVDCASPDSPLNYCWSAPEFLGDSNNEESDEEKQLIGVTENVQRAHVKRSASYELIKALYSDYDEPKRPNFLQFDEPGLDLELKTFQSADEEPPMSRLIPLAINEKYGSMEMYGATPSPQWFYSIENNLPDYSDEEVRFVDDSPDMEEEKRLRGAENTSQIDFIDSADEAGFTADELSFDMSRHSDTSCSDAVEMKDTGDKISAIRTSSSAVHLSRSSMDKEHIDGIRPRSPFFGQQNPLNVDEMIRVGRCVSRSDRRLVHQSFSYHGGMRDVNRSLIDYDTIIQNHYNRCSSPGCRKYALELLTARTLSMPCSSDDDEEEWLNLKSSQMDSTREASIERPNKSASMPSELLDDICFHSKDHQKDEATDTHVKDASETLKLVGVAVNEVEIIEDRRNILHSIQEQKAIVKKLSLSATSLESSNCTSPTVAEQFLCDGSAYCNNKLNATPSKSSRLDYYRSTKSAENNPYIDAEIYPPNPSTKISSPTLPENKDILNKYTTKIIDVDLPSKQRTNIIEISSLTSSASALFCTSDVENPRNKMRQDSRQSMLPVANDLLVYNSIGTTQIKSIENKSIVIRKSATSPGFHNLSAIIPKQRCKRRMLPICPDDNQRPSNTFDHDAYGGGLHCSTSWCEQGSKRDEYERYMAHIKEVEKLWVLKSPKQISSSPPSELVDRERQRYTSKSDERQYSGSTPEPEEEEEKEDKHAAILPFNFTNWLSTDAVSEETAATVRRPAHRPKLYFEAPNSATSNCGATANLLRSSFPTSTIAAISSITSPETNETSATIMTGRISKGCRHNVVIQLESDRAGGVMQPSGEPFHPLWHSDGIPYIEVRRAKINISCRLRDREDLAFEATTYYDYDSPISPPFSVLPSPAPLPSGHRRLPALPVKSSSAALLSGLGPLPMSATIFPSASGIGCSSAQHPSKEDHRICFGTDSVLGRSTLLFDDSYYEEDGINGNQLTSKKAIYNQDDSSGVSSCCTGSEHLNPTHRAHSTFIPRHDDEVLLEIGDAVHVERECEDHWCYGTNLRTCQQGIFPSAHVCEIDLVEEICMGALPSNANPRQWFAETMENERDTFYLTMLASIEVAHHKGNDVLVQAMNKVLSLYQNKEEIIVPQTVLMEVSFRGIHIIDKRKKNFFQCPTFDFFYSLQNISFCGAHPKQLRYFGFITKHPLLPRFACHVFLSNESTQPIVEAIGRAFKRSYDEYMAFAHPTEDIYLE